MLIGRDQQIGHERKADQEHAGRGNAHDARRMNIAVVPELFSGIQISEPRQGDRHQS